MITLFRKDVRATSTPLSRFVNETPPKMKKRVYKRVLAMATEAQNKIIAKAKMAS